jgi:hypothetical protein
MGISELEDMDRLGWLMLQRLVECREAFRILDSQIICRKQLCDLIPRRRSLGRCDPGCLRGSLRSRRLLRRSREPQTDCQRD